MKDNSKDVLDFGDSYKISNSSSQSSDLQEKEIRD